MNKPRNSKNPTRGIKNRVLKGILTALPLGGVAIASFFDLQAWVHQALVLVTILWFYTYYLMDTFFMGG